MRKPVERHDHQGRDLRWPISFLFSVIVAISAMQSACLAADDDPGDEAPVLSDDPAILYKEERAAIQPIEPVKIILVGDSTTAVQSGWGASFCSHHVTLDVACVNMGRNGRSTFSYRAEEAWDLVLREAEVKGYKAVYILIQFAHNDQPGKPGHSTDLEREFRPNLERFVKEARDRNAIPILVTPLTRRAFKDGEVIRTLDPWAEVVRQVSEAQNAPLVELYAQSLAVVERAGAVGSLMFARGEPSVAVRRAAETGTTVDKETGADVTDAAPLRSPPFDELPVPKTSFDYTHLGPDGGRVFSGIVARELILEIPSLRPYIYATPE